MKFFKRGGRLPDGAKLYRKTTAVPMVRMKEPFECECREGVLKGQPGDYLAEDGHGGFYPVSAEFHAENYQLVEDE